MEQAKAALTPEEIRALFDLAATVQELRSVKKAVQMIQAGGA